MQTRRSFLVMLTATGAVAIASDASAHDYPSRPITIIVPAAAGGPGDIFARIIAARARVALGQPVIVENVGGASGTIGASRAARAAADGYTLVLGNLSTHVLMGAASTTPYDVIKDFEPIALVASNPLVIAARKTMPANDLRGLIAWLKANPGRAAVGTAGPGSLPHLAGLLFESMTGTSLRFVPYRGVSIATQDLMTGQIDMCFDFTVTCLPLVRSGDIKAYAIPGKSRLHAAPEIPTVNEAGLPGFYVAGENSLWAPRATPREAIDKLNSVVVDAFADPAVSQRLAEIGQQIPPRDEQTPEALRSFQQAEIAKWWPIIKAAGIMAG